MIESCRISITCASAAKGVLRLASSSGPTCYETSSPVQLSLGARHLRVSAFWAMKSPPRLEWLSRKCCWRPDFVSHPGRGGSRAIAPIIKFLLEYGHSKVMGISRLQSIRNSSVALNEHLVPGIKQSPTTTCSIRRIT